MISDHIVVLGAGVSGLTTALLLSRDPSKNITVVAKHMPGDYDIEYCSPWAGASFFPVGKPNTAHGKWERATWPVLKQLAEKHPEAGICFQPTLVFSRSEDVNSATGQWFAELVQKDPWYKDLVDNFEEIPAENLDSRIDNGSRFTIPALAPRQCSKNGVIFKRATFKHVTEAGYAHHSGKKADVVVNCTGLSSKSLGGVQDDTLFPIRGQVVLVRNDPHAMYSVSGCDDGEDEVAYMMARAAGGGTVLGGSYQKNNWDPLPEPNLAIRIMTRAINLCPELVNKGQGIEGLDVIRHGVGLRPARADGPRVEKEQVDDLAVVHNYGHGGFGYQASYGCAATAVRLIHEVLQEKGRPKM
ncbi:hypothetical protein N7509_013706 [Penicillium cosmopolitanum]|uniref:D-amino-acid oxidase n=1 Tax=Penicillium cosmopolitanum TaxID=1131564 RepID=A0A9W9SE95_9EURO|nr:uncharacterized protein N7509_013706 [Penicillium cosmopolitanum]KAJ5376820.1 hypothetical protein N7509_013706 [Penicillium cosmopolitanum]